MEHREPNYTASFFFSGAVGKPVIGPNRKKSGILTDIIVNTTPVYPKALAIRIKHGKKTKDIPISNIEPESLLSDQIVLRTDLKSIHSIKTELMENTLALKESVFDRQIVDFNGAKVIRVNDIRMLRTGSDINVTDVDVGYRGILRRLGLDRPLDKILHSLSPRGINIYSNKFISWEYVHPVLPQNRLDTIKLTVTKENFKKLNPSDIAAMIEELDYEQRKNLLDQIPDEVAAKVLSETDTETTQELLVVQDEERAADILEEMAPDKAADILGDMQEKKAQEIINQMETEEAETVTELLEYEDDTAGGLMTTEYLSFPPTMMAVTAVQELIKASQDKYIETVYDAFIVENSKLVGTVSLREMLISPGHRSLGEIMNKKPVIVDPEEKAKKVAELFSKYNLMTMPVVQKGGELEGIITVDDVVEFLMRKWK